MAAKVKRRQGPITRALPFPVQISHYMRPLASILTEGTSRAIEGSRENT